MKKILTAVLLTALCSCSTALNSPEVTVVEIPTHCETTEIGKFKTGEETLLIYGEGADVNKAKAELKCMLMMGIGESIRQVTRFQANRIHGASIFLEDTKVFVQYRIDPYLDAMSQIVIMPSFGKEDMYTVSEYVLWGTVEDVAEAFYTENFNLPVLGGANYEITQEAYMDLLQELTKDISTLTEASIVVEPQEEEK
jgi:hypothetical protein